MIKLIILFLSLNILAFETAEQLEQKKAVKQFFFNEKNSLLDIQTHYYIRNLANKIIKTKYDFFVINDEGINAFATSYGFIGINKGLISITDSESELASVIAHEIAHIKMEHFERFAKKIANNKFLILGGILLSTLSKSSEFREAIISGSIAGNAQLQINFTRSHEVEADDYGYKLLIKSEFDESAMSSFFKKLKEDKKALEFLSTHPLSSNRVANSFSVKDSKKHISSFEYEILKAKFNLKTENISNNEKVIAYMDALSYFNSGKYQKTIDTLKLLNNHSINILKGRAFANIKNLNKAKYYLNKDDEISQYYLANAYYINHKPLEALSILKQQNYKKTTIYNYNLIADIELSLNNNDRFHYNKALSFILSGYTKKAIVQFNIAKDLTQDRDLFSVLEYKIKNVVK